MRPLYGAVTGDRAAIVPRTPRRARRGVWVGSHPRPQSNHWVVLRVDGSLGVAAAYVERGHEIGRPRRAGRNGRGSVVIGHTCMDAPTPDGSTDYLFSQRAGAVPAWNRYISPHWSGQGFALAAKPSGR